MLTGSDLTRDIDAFRPAEGELAFWWLGQHSFVVKAGGRVIYLDPFLTPGPKRLIEPLLAPDEVTNATVVVGSHDHADHIDREAWPAIAAASPGAVFVVAELLRPGLARDLRLPSERLVGLDDGAVAELADVRITGIAAAHEFLDQDPSSGKFPYLGYVIEVGGCVVYHSGDTCMYEGLQSKLKRRPLDVMFLPINGRDAERLAAGCIGNMTYQEAADLAGALRPRLVIPAHYDMFAGNLGDPKAFEAYMRVKYPAQGVQLCRHGERHVLGRPSP